MCFGFDQGNEKWEVGDEQAKDTGFLSEIMAEYAQVFPKSQMCLSDSELRKERFRSSLKERATVAILGAQGEIISLGGGSRNHVWLYI